MLIFLEISHENGIILSQKGVQANHMKHSVSATVEINKEKVYITMLISYLFSCYMGLIWDRIYNDHAQECRCLCNHSPTSFQGSDTRIILAVSRFDICG